jgi:hypothetical protein
MAGLLEAELLHIEIEDIPVHPYFLDAIHTQLKFNLGRTLATLFGAATSGRSLDGDRGAIFHTSRSAIRGRVPEKARDLVLMGLAGAG